eukprot:1160938-Pelagomonas_calceolata.AAC.10
MRPTNTLPNKWAMALTHCDTAKAPLGHVLSQLASPVIDMGRGSVAYQALFSFLLSFYSQRVPEEYPKYPTANINTYTNICNQLKVYSYQGLRRHCARQIPLTKDL